MVTFFLRLPRDVVANELFYIALHILDICKMRKNVRIGVII